MGAAGAEFHDRPAGGGPHNPVGLGRNQALVVEGDQQQRFEQLALDGRALDRDDRLLREDRHALLDRPDVAVQLKVGEVIEEGFAEHSGAAQVGDVRLGKAEVIDRINELLQAGHDRIAAAIRHTAEEHIKDRDLVLVALLKIAVGHGQLIKIGHGGQVAFDIQHRAWLLLWRVSGIKSAGVSRACAFLLR